MIFNFQQHLVNLVNSRNVFVKEGMCVGGSWCRKKYFVVESHPSPRVPTRLVVGNRGFDLHTTTDRSPLPQSMKTRHVFSPLPASKDEGRHAFTGVNVVEALTYDLLIYTTSWMFPTRGRCVRRWTVRCCKYPWAWDVRLISAKWVPPLLKQKHGYSMRSINCRKMDFSCHCSRLLCTHYCHFTCSSVAT